MECTQSIDLLVLFDCNIMIKTANKSEFYLERGKYFGASKDVVWGIHIRTEDLQFNKHYRDLWPFIKVEAIKFTRLLRYKECFTVLLTPRYSLVSEPITEVWRLDETERVRIL